MQISKLDIVGKMHVKKNLRTNLSVRQSGLALAGAAHLIINLIMVTTQPFLSFHLCFLTAAMLSCPAASQALLASEAQECTKWEQLRTATGEKKQAPQNPEGY